MSKISLLWGLLVLQTGTVWADPYLFFLESQMVSGYSLEKARIVFYSHAYEDVMQKPSLGFDYLQKFTGSSGDNATLAIQARLAFNVNEGQLLEPQLYNAYFRFRTAFGYFRIGHHRPSQGLTSYLDNHALLLNSLSMNGYGFDRDWGIGWNLDTEWGDLGLSVTTGTGMPIYLEGNYWIAFRSAYGILNRDNYTLGLSLAGGQKLETMGYKLMHSEPYQSRQAMLDMAYLLNNIEHRMELGVQDQYNQNGWSVLYRLTVNFLEENRLKIEFQPLWQHGSDDNHQITAAVAYQWLSSLTLRSMYQYQHQPEDHRLVLQLYYYASL